MTYGGFWIRFVAALIDGFIVGIATFIITTVISLLGFGSAASMEDPDAMMATLGTALILQVIVILLISVLYYVIMESSSKQGTYGKILVGLKVVGLDGGQITFGKAFIRFLAKNFLSAILAIGFIMAAFTEKKQGLHDMIASTLVVTRQSSGGA